MRITFISDTHTKHEEINQHLPGGDLIIHAGDFMNSGRHASDVAEFAYWFSGLDNYEHKVFIAGNHDRMFEDYPDLARDLLTAYGPELIYLQDKAFEVNGIKLYGSPWQPAFYDWAFNLPRCGQDLMRVWNQIPKDTDILVCHTMPFGHCDVTGNLNVGCELLRVRTDELRPKIFVGGHIHSGAGYKWDGYTHFFNASVLDNSYHYKNRPMTIDWDPETNEIEFI
jgi:Icc-related predicted phosphoesterase